LCDSPFQGKPLAFEKFVLSGFNLTRVPDRDDLLRLSDGLACGLGTLRLAAASAACALALLCSAVGTHAGRLLRAARHRQAAVIPWSLLARSQSPQASLQPHRLIRPMIDGDTIRVYQKQPAA
jgi:hypothetical protein